METAPPTLLDGGARNGFPHLTGLSAQRLIEFFALRLAPALAAAIIIYSRQDLVLEAAIGLASMLVVSGLLRRTDYPMHLMPVATAFQYLLAAPLGMALTLLIAAADGNSATEMLPEDVVAPALGAVLITGVGGWVARGVTDDRTVAIGVIGSTDFASVLQTELEAIGVRRYHVVGTIATNGEADASGKTLGHISDLRSVVLRNRIELLVLGPLKARDAAAGEELFKASGVTRLDVFEQVADACLDLPVSMIDSPQFYEEVFGHVPLGTTNSAWFAYLLHPRYRAGWPISKRALDLSVGLLASILFLPVLLVAAVAIKLGDGGPVFHRQRRIGGKGREIEVVKLRTMRADAESAGQQWADEHDSRITPVGAWLRRLHVDELPQLWLVLKGEMSLVGPRPEQPEIVGELEAAFSYYDRRHLVKPGITGWAQVRCGYAGSHIGTAWKLCHDLYYLKRRSMVFDLLIMIETLARVIVPEPIARPDQRLIVARRAGDQPIS